MSGQRFDELTKTLATPTGTSRRRFIRGVAAVAAAAVFGPRAAQGAECVTEGKSCTSQKCCRGYTCLIDNTSGTDKFCCPDNLVCGSRCCPTGATCSTGKCVCPANAPTVCPGGTLPVGQCVNTQIDVNNCGQCGVVCPESTDPCRTKACVSGSCTTVADVSKNGLPCETGNLCTADTCNDGRCQQGPVTVICPDPQCQKCNPATGTCQPVANGTACDDGNKCTLNDTCQAGVCTPGPLKDCSDNNECTTDSCDPATGNCVHTPLTGTPCETGNKCTADTCQNGTCQQGPVTVTCPQCQLCDTVTGTCKAGPNGVPCDDGNVCTLGDTCQNGTCQPGTPAAPGTPCGGSRVCCGTSRGTVKCCGTGQVCCGNTTCCAANKCSGGVCR
jgi:hypothetical protein